MTEDDKTDKDFKKEVKEELNKQRESVEVFGKRLDVSYIINRRGQLTPDLYEIGKQVRQAFNIVILKDRKNRTINNLFYEDGIYRPGARDFCDRIAEEIFKGQATVNLKNELWQHVKDQGWEYYDKWLSEGFIVLENGVIDLSKLVNKSDPLLPWDPKIHSLNKLNVKYVPGATPHIWLNHLNFVMPDSTNQEAFKTFIGSFLDVNSYAHQKILVLYGVEGAGKTITLKVVIGFFGQENIAFKTFQDLAENRFASADLFGAIANINEELPQQTVSSLERLNRLTGGYIDGEHKGKDPFGFVQNAKLAAACNDLPQIDGDLTTIRAFMSRLVIIVFTRKIRETSQEVTDYDKVILTEKEGILNWILDGYLDYVRGGKKIPWNRTTDQTLKFYIANSDSVRYFGEKACQLDPNSFEFKDDLYSAYLRFCRLIGLKPLGSDTFKKNFPAKFKGEILDELKDRKGGRKGRKQARAFVGIKLRPEEEWEQDHEDEEEDEEKGNNDKKPSSETFNPDGEYTEKHNTPDTQLGNQDNTGLTNENSSENGDASASKDGVLGVSTFRGDTRLHVEETKDGQPSIDIDLLKSKLKEHLETHNGIAALGSVFSLLGEWLNEKDGNRIHEIIGKLKDGHGFKFDYVTQNVSLVKEGSP
jgi:P4 family phage/plasmid primase-like protien